MEFDQNNKENIYEFRVISNYILGWSPFPEIMTTRIFYIISRASF